MHVVQFEVLISHEKTFPPIQSPRQMIILLDIELAAGVPLTSFLSQGGMVFYG